MLLQMISDLWLRPAGTTEEGSRSFREVPREPGPWTPGCRLLAAGKHADCSPGLFGCSCRLGRHGSEGRKRKKAVCGWDTECIFMLYMHQEWMFLQKRHLRNYLCVCLCVFFFSFPSQLHIHSGDFEGEKKNWKANFFSPCNISLKNMKKEQL